MQHLQSSAVSLSTTNGTTEVLQKQRGPQAGTQPEDHTQPFDMDRYDPFVIHATLTVGSETVATDTAWPQPLQVFGPIRSPSPLRDCTNARPDSYIRGAPLKRFRL